jgi:DNA-binding response OmpR family regulator
MQNGRLISYSVTIIEDSADMRVFLRKAIQIHGYSVNAFANSQTALEDKKKQTYLPHLILVD